MKRGRPKGRSNDKKSYGPLGDLIRQYRIKNQMGLSDVARSCKCSVQFISNIEHGRAPLPWDKANKIAAALSIPLEELQAANLTIRSDFQGFVGSQNGQSRSTKVGSRILKSNTALKDQAASLLALTSQDKSLRELLQKYSAASEMQKKKFFQTAKKILTIG